MSFDKDHWVYKPHDEYFTTMELREFIESLGPDTIRIDYTHQLFKYIKYYEPEKTVVIRINHYRDIIELSNIWKSPFKTLECHYPDEIMNFCRFASEIVCCSHEFIEHKYAGKTRYAGLTKFDNMPPHDTTVNTYSIWRHIPAGTNLDGAYKLVIRYAQKFLENYIYLDEHHFKKVVIDESSYVDVLPLATQIKCDKLVIKLYPHKFGFDKICNLLEESNFKQVTLDSTIGTVTISNINKLDLNECLVKHNDCVTSFEEFAYAMSNIHNKSARM